MNYHCKACGWTGTTPNLSHATHLHTETLAKVHTYSNRCPKCYAPVLLDLPSLRTT